MEVLYKSTRGNGETVTASRAILKGLSDDGGLFVPTSIPALDVPMEKLAAMSYQEVAYEVMSRFLTDFTEDELKTVLQTHTMQNLTQRKLQPLTKADGVYYLDAVPRRNDRVQGHGTFHSAASDDDRRKEKTA